MRALFAGCGADTGRKAGNSNGEVAVHPMSSRPVNDIEAMNENGERDPSAPKLSISELSMVRRVLEENGPPSRPERFERYPTSTACRQCVPAVRIQFLIFLFVFRVSQKREARHASINGLTRRRSGSLLVELLVVIAIIGVFGGLFVAAVQAAREAPVVCSA